MWAPRWLDTDGPETMRVWPDAAVHCTGVAGSVVFFFSSRRRHTRCSRDWSSDVCSSDLIFQEIGARNEEAKTLLARAELRRAAGDLLAARELLEGARTIFDELGTRDEIRRDRKSTRLNSSHGYISYAVFCLKKKTLQSSPPQGVAVAETLRRTAVVVCPSVAAAGLLGHISARRNRVSSLEVRELSVLRHRIS